MECPKCSKTELEARVAGGVKLDRCSSCGGLWLDMLELERLLEAVPKDLINEDREAKQAASEADEDGESKISCPNCRGTTYLIKLNSRHRPGTILDSCTVCHGCWLDAGELARLSGGGLQRWLRGLFGK